MTDVGLPGYLDAFVDADVDPVFLQALAGALVFGSAGAAFAGDIGNGENIFNANCAACHAGGQNVIQNEKTLYKDALTQYLDGGMKESSVVYQVRSRRKALGERRNAEGETRKAKRDEGLLRVCSSSSAVCSICEQVTNGKNAMPAFGGRLSDDEIADVASYVIDQATGEKW